MLKNCRNGCGATAGLSNTEMGGGQKRKWLYSSWVPIQNQATISPSRRPTARWWIPIRTTQIRWRRSSNRKDEWYGSAFPQRVLLAREFLNGNGQCFEM